MKKNITLIFLLSIFSISSRDSYSIEGLSKDKINLQDENYDEDMLNAVNKLRKEGCRCGRKYMPPVEPLKWSIALEKSAKKHSFDMYKNDFFSHTGSDGSTMSDRLKDVGYNSYMGENILIGYTNVTAAVKLWENSPGHCRNMMDENYTHMGSATVGTYCTQTFGKR